MCAFATTNKAPGVYIDEIQRPGPIAGVGTSTRRVRRAGARAGRSACRSGSRTGPSSSRRSATRRREPYHHPAARLRDPRGRRASSRTAAADCWFVRVGTAVRRARADGSQRRGRQRHARRHAPSRTARRATTSPSRCRTPSIAAGHDGPSARQPRRSPRPSTRPLLAHADGRREVRRRRPGRDRRRHEHRGGDRSPRSRARRSRSSRPRERLRASDDVRHRRPGAGHNAAPRRGHDRHRAGHRRRVHAGRNDRRWSVVNSVDGSTGIVTLAAALANAIRDLDGRRPGATSQSQEFTLVIGGAETFERALAWIRATAATSRGSSTRSDVDAARGGLRRTRRRRPTTCPRVARPANLQGGRRRRSGARSGRERVQGRHRRAPARSTR